MKKYYIQLITCLVLASCVDYDDVSSEVNVAVQLQMPAEFTQGTDYEGHTVVLSVNGQDTKAVTDENGVAHFKNVVPDVYTVSTTWELTAEEYSALTGDPTVTSGAYVSGALSNQLISDAAEQNITLATNVAVQRDVVISKIYSAGSKDQNNKTYRAGKYVELYNQSDKDVTVSGLYMGLLDSSNPQPFTLQNLHDAYADSVVIVKQVFRIPADSVVVMKPGATLLLTNSATDHSDVSEFESDLTKADFESKDATGTMVNNPDVPALLTAWSAYSKDATMNLVQGGPCGIILFKTDEDISQWNTTYAYGKTSGQLYLLVPKRVITDGVDYLKNKSTGVDLATKRLYTEIDAGYTVINSISGWTGEVVYRRTAKVEADGRKILMDTNNSTNDFKVSTTIKPREYDAE